MKRLLSVTRTIRKPLINFLSKLLIASPSRQVSVTPPSLNFFIRRYRLLFVTITSSSSRCCIAATVYPALNKLTALRLVPKASLVMPVVARKLTLECTREFELNKFFVVWLVRSIFPSYRVLTLDADPPYNNVKQRKRRTSSAGD